MKAGILRLRGTFITGVVFLLVVSCGTTAPTRFYLMDPMADAGPGSGAAGTKGASIALAHVELPEHLNRPQIVTRQNGHQLQVDEFNRWAESLGAHVTAILAENLSKQLGTEGVVITNRHKQTDSDFHLSIQILRFDGWPGKEAVLDCRWYLGTGDEPADEHPERFRITRSVEGDGYPDLVAALSRMLADLSREIARQIKGS